MEGETKARMTLCTVPANFVLSLLRVLSTNLKPAFWRIQLSCGKFVETEIVGCGEEVAWYGEFDCICYMECPVARTDKEDAQSPE